LRVDEFSPQSPRLFEREPARRFGGWRNNWVVLPFLPANTTAENGRGACAFTSAGSVPRCLRLTARSQQNTNPPRRLPPQTTPA